MSTLLCWPVALSLALAGVTAAAATPFDRVERLAFNRAAARLNLPLYWVADRDGNRTVDPDEVATLLFYPPAARWVDGGRFTPEFEQAYAEIATWAGEPPLAPGLTADERQRRALVIADLDQGRPTLVRSDLRGLSNEERTLVGRMLKIAARVDALYARQIGADSLRDRVPADDRASQSLFRRNWGPACVAPQTEANPACSAIPGAPKVLYGGYPALLHSEAGFCAALERNTAAPGLTDPFTVVGEREGRLVAVPVTAAYHEQAQAIALELRAAAADVLDPAEAALKAYLLAAAQGFETNVWLDADESWARMNAQNSRWYVRVAPDEVYRDPCRLKGGFHLTFARINADSLAWQAKLTPLRQDMEKALAERAGPPYRERTVTFRLPDFVDIVLNAGDDRNPLGGTIGQSLPNWGPVANEGRGRTVAMSNLYDDPDSRAARRQGAESLLDAASFRAYADDRQAGLLNTILHEAAHNLGPSHEYRVAGKTDREIFGGALASTMEELKAQTGALWLVDSLRARSVIDEAFARRVYVDAFVWAMGHIANGMFEGGDRTRPKSYSQLAAIQLGLLEKEGAVAWTSGPRPRTAGTSEPSAFVSSASRLLPSGSCAWSGASRLGATGPRPRRFFRSTSRAPPHGTASSPNVCNASPRPASCTPSSSEQPAPAPLGRGRNSERRGRCLGIGRDGVAPHGASPDHS
jgi:hypothetical protein